MRKSGIPIQHDSQLYNSRHIQLFQRNINAHSKPATLQTSKLITRSKQMNTMLVIELLPVLLTLLPG